MLEKSVGISNDAYIEDDYENEAREYTNIFGKQTKKMLENGIQGQWNEKPDLSSFNSINCFSSALKSND